MARQRHLSKAPIREAVIDIRVTPAVTFESIEGLRAQLKERFPNAQNMSRRMFGFEFGESEFKTSSVDKGPLGVRLTSEDGKHIVQLRVDGFTFSRLPQYLAWEQMRAEAVAVWKYYLESTRPEKVTRTAVRYINVMNLPLPITDFKEYMTAPPEVPAALPQAVASFLSRVVIVDTASGTAAIVTQALETALGDKAPVVLDIDAFKEFEVAGDSDSVWGTLEILRDFKNRIFFESITEKTAELFE